MSLRKATSRQVNPVVAAVAIILVLGVVQYTWWQGLVAKKKGPHGAGPMSGGPTGPPQTVIYGIRTANVDTLAGSVDAGDVDGIGRIARFDGPSAIALDSTGNVLVADSRNNRIRVISPKGQTKTLTGQGVGFQDGPLQSALFNIPSGIAVASDGSIYVADTKNNRIRLIKGDVVSTLAGGESGMVDGPAAAARFNLPTSLVILKDATGESLLVSDSGNKRIRQIRLGQPNLSVQTLRSTSSIPVGVGTDGKVAAAAMPSESSLALGSVVLQSARVVPVNSSDDNTDGKIKLMKPMAVCAAPGGWYVLSADHAALFRIRGGAAQVLIGCALEGVIRRGCRDGTGDKAQIGQASGMATDGKRTIYIADTSNNAIRRVVLPEPDAEIQVSEPRRWRPEGELN